MKTVGITMWLVLGLIVTGLMGVGAVVGRLCCAGHSEVVPDYTCQPHQSPATCYPAEIEGRRIVCVHRYGELLQYGIFELDDGSTVPFEERR